MLDQKNQQANKGYDRSAGITVSLVGVGVLGLLKETIRMDKRIKMF
ncbi:MAG: hypothetical protein WKI04_17285 [Ferruginibacter sp.]